MNKVILVGRLGGDPQTRLAGGKTVVSFSLATASGKNNTEWHNIEIWDKPAEIAEQYLTKGDMVLLEGRIKYEQYEKTGQKVNTTKIVVTQIELLPNPKKEPTMPPQPESPKIQQDSDDDLPF